MGNPFKAKGLVRSTVPLDVSIIQRCIHFWELEAGMVWIFNILHDPLFCLTPDNFTCQLGTSTSICSSRECLISVGGSLVVGRGSWVPNPNSFFLSRTGNSRNRQDLRPKT